MRSVSRARLVRSGSGLLRVSVTRNQPKENGNGNLHGFVDSWIWRFDPPGGLALYAKRRLTYPAEMPRNLIELGLKVSPLFSLLLACGCAATAKTNKFVPLFNGKDLSGWHIKCQAADQNKTFWKVDAGTILCDSMERKDHNYVWLLSDGEYSDFELRLKFQAYKDSPGNSGLQFRSRFDDTTSGGWLHGPQVDIHPPQAMPWRTGLIYDETRGEQRWIFPSLKDWNMDPKLAPSRFIFKYAEDGDDWNELVLICRGTHVKTILNGIVRTDWDGGGVLDNAAHLKHDVGRSGHFALQLHSGDELRIRFKDIQVRRL